MNVLFRWAGSKDRCADRIAGIICDHLSRHPRAKLISLFYGTGAIEQEVARRYPRRDILAAENAPPLRALYRALKDPGGPAAIDAALRELEKLGRSREVYEQVRAQPPPSTWASFDVAYAARFLWLSTFCFRGVWRVNQKGQMNVPPDVKRLAVAKLPELADLQRVAEAIRRTTFFANWTLLVGGAGKIRSGDIILSDPPYLGTYSSFTENPFDEEDHRQLALALEELLPASSADPDPAIIAFNSAAAKKLYRWARAVKIQSPARMRNAGGEKHVDWLFLRGVQDAAAPWPARTPRGRRSSSAAA